MDSEACGFFQGSRCLPHKQCKCSAKGLLFSEIVCRTIPASRQGVRKHLTRHWPCPGFHLIHWSSSWQIPPGPMLCNQMQSISLYSVVIVQPTFKSYLIKSKFMLPGTDFWEAVLLHVLLVADSIGWP